MKNEPTSRNARLYLFSEAFKRHATLFEVRNNPQQVLKTSPESIQSPNNKSVASTQSL